MRNLCLFAVALHLVLIGAVSIRDTFTVLAQGQTIFPPQLEATWRNAERVTQTALGEQFATGNPVRQFVETYLNLAGIESGYGFFAPNVPAANELVFELHYPDGRTEYELPRVNNRAAGLRVASLLDVLGRTEDDVVRKGLIKFLVYSAWREHPEASTIRAILGTVSFPSPAEFKMGKRESYRVSHAYDATFEKDGDSD